MKKICFVKNVQLIGIALLIVFAVSCKKDNSTKQQTPVNAKPAELGLFEFSNGTDYRIYTTITKIGTKTVDYDEVFDTGSSGLTLDATDIVPATMFTDNGFQFTGDSVVVGGITITNKTSVMEYGDAIQSTNVYGNIAYANITLNNSSGGVTIQRVPMFLYYKILDGKGNKLTAHSADIFGVATGYSYASNLIESPLSYYSPGTGLTKGFKLATLIKTDFTSGGVYEESLLTLGLTNADLTANGFIMHPLSVYGNEGYLPYISGTVSYNGGSPIAATFLFDTGTPETTVIEDKSASSLKTTFATTNAIGNLPVGSTVTIKTNKGFTYTYTTGTNTNVTEVQNPTNTQDFRTIFSLEFFTDNEFLTDYSGNQIGLKNN